MSIRSGYPILFLYLKKVNENNFFKTRKVIFVILTVKFSPMEARTAQEVVLERVEPRAPVRRRRRTRRRRQQLIRVGDAGAAVEGRPETTGGRGGRGRSVRRPWDLRRRMRRTRRLRQRRWGQGGGGRRTQGT
jgi:hypothetical protein